MLQLNVSTMTQGQECDHVSHLVGCLIGDARLYSSDCIDLLLNMFVCLRLSSIRILITEFHQKLFCSADIALSDQAL